MAQGYARGNPPLHGVNMSSRELLMLWIEFSADRHDGAARLGWDA